MSTTRPRRLALLTAVLALSLVLPSAVAAGSGVRTLEGTLVVAHGEDYSKGAPRAVWFTKLRTSTGEVELVFSGKRPDGFLNGARVRVRGQLTGGTLAVGANRADAQVTQAVAAITGQRKVAILLLKFAATDAEPYTVAQAKGVIFDNANSVANYFAEQSYGQVTMTGDVFGYYTISINTSTCDFTDIGNKGRAAAEAAGVDLSSYTQIQYVHNHLSSCGWAGLAWVPGRDSWLNQALNLRVSAHELSHNFGVHHASTMSCSEGGVRVTLSSNAANCTSSEYGDPFSVMGAAQTRHTHNQQLASLGWLTGSDLVTVSSSGNYQVGAADLPNGGAPRAVRVPRGNGTWFYLELRAPIGTQFDNFSPSDPAVNGVSIRISQDWSVIVQSQLLDTTPATSTYGDAPLALNQSFLDPLSSVSITTLSVGGGVATVNVSWGPDSIAPTTPGNPQVVATGTNTARFSWTASTDNRGVTGYRVSRDGTVLQTVTTTQFNDSGLTPGASYTYSVVALDAAGNTSGADTRAWTQPVADTTPPNAFTLSYGVTKAKTTLSWTASTDNVGVTGYRVFRNNVLVATLAASARSWQDNRKTSVMTYFVQAFDAAGNTRNSNSVSVPRR